jgi:hypothetical protein
VQQHAHDAALGVTADQASPAKAIQQRQGNHAILGDRQLRRQHDLNGAATVRAGDPGLGAVQDASEEMLQL